MQCKCTGLTKYANVSAHIPTYIDLLSPGAYPELVGPPMYVWNLFVKKTKEFKAALITSFILLLIGVNIVMLMNITITIDKTHNIYDLIYAASTYMVL